MAKNSFVAEVTFGKFFVNNVTISVLNSKLHNGMASSQKIECQRNDFSITHVPF